MTEYGLHKSKINSLNRTGYFVLSKAALNMVAEVYKTIAMTNQRNTSSGNDLTINAAISTAMVPGIAMRSAAFLL